MVKIIENGGITSTQGIKVATTRVGIKPKGENNDLTLIVSDEPGTVVGTFTRNLVQAAPVQWDSKIVEEVGIAKAIVINTGIANAVTGAPGLESCQKTADKVSELLGIPSNNVLCASTGVIGPQLPMDKILGGLDVLSTKLTDDIEEAHKAANAILTTDTHSKEIAVSFEIAGKTCTIGAMCKGSGMIHPNMGTMLGFLLSDLKVEHSYALKTIRTIIEKTFNMVSVDGDTSTNDTVLLLANGLAGNDELNENSSDADKKEFEDALYTVCEFLAKNIAKDGEGATRLFTAHVVGAPDYETAKTLAKSIITSSLTKAAIFGKDANWGRIFCAMGYSGANFEPSKTDIYIKSANGSIKLVENGLATDFSEEEALDILTPDEITAECDIKSGDVEAFAWGCDLTYDYVTINADYRS